jgi:hypothetical protein
MSLLTALSNQTSHRYVFQVSAINFYHFHHFHSKRSICEHPLWSSKTSQIFASFEFLFSPYLIQNISDVEKEYISELTGAAFPC